MREILFRGKPKDESQYYFFSQIWKDNCKDGFVYGSLVTSKDRYYISVSALCSINSNINNGMTSMIEVIPETVGQYIGLDDKNGKKIFEGDILAYETYYPKRMISGVVCAEEWNCSCCHGVFGYALDGKNYDIRDHDRCEIIGNIHDNPELVKGGESE